MAFSNPIAGAGGDLVIAQLQSPNFAPDSAGWQINKAGDAQFNDVTMTGSFSGEDFLINTDGMFFYAA